MTSPNTHALRLLSARKLDPSPGNIRYASRRVLAAGRLAELGAHMIPGILRVSSVEHGDADMMASGAIMAEVWLDAPAHEWDRRAREVMQLEQIAASRPKPLRLMLAIYRASWLDRMRERLAWRLAR
jgi:hypothetical protein